jgi:hypothetical protein
VVQYLASLSPEKSMIEQKKHHRPDHRYEQAVKIQPGNTPRAEQTEQESTCNRAQYSQNDIEQHPLALFINDLTADKPGDEPKD